MECQRTFWRDNRDIPFRKTGLGILLPLFVFVGIISIFVLNFR